MNARLGRMVERAKRHGIVIFAGAGVSAAAPSSLPSWKPLNEAILGALAKRVETLRGRPGWLADVVAAVGKHRTEDRFPPEYQAQVLHEMSGEHYFRALQALDIDVVNEGHHAIAALASSGLVGAILTTNFDRLIERALEQRGVPFSAAIDDATFAALEARVARAGVGASESLPIIKIHGCVSDHRSMIDTLKQRRLGRSAKLQACLDTLHSRLWIYVGLSAADLEADPHYLGLCAGAKGSPGALYVQWPGSPPNPAQNLSRGATTLMAAYAEQGEVIVADAAEVLRDLCTAVGVSPPASSASRTPLGPAQVSLALEGWANGLNAAAVPLCIGAVLEAVGEAEAGVRVIDRFVRHELVGPNREGCDYRNLQLHYGRMGAALGRFISVPDLNGAASNASVETVQSLLRLTGTELELAATGHLATAWLWLGSGEDAQRAALKVATAAEQWSAWGVEIQPANELEGLPKPRSVEEAVDGWLSVAQVAAVAGQPSLISYLVDRAATLMSLALKAGDPVRAARVASQHLLLLSETAEDVPALDDTLQAVFADAERVGDGFARGFRELALGRWLVGVGGLALGRGGSASAVELAARALRHLERADDSLRRQGMDPWLVFSLLQQAKAYADLHRFDEAQAKMNLVKSALERFPIWRCHTYEAAGQILSMQGGVKEADTALRAALKAARAAGLRDRADRIELSLRG